MIVQRDTSDFVLVRQPDHARLAADLIGAWTAGDLPSNPRRDWILAATRAHDDGWEEEDAAMIVDPEGAPVDFITSSLVVKHRVWPRCIDRLAAESPYVSALVAQHALTVYGDHRTKPEWDPFFAGMAARRAALLDRCGPEARETIDEDYRFVRMADILSLIFCHGWRQPFDHDGRHITLDAAVLTVTPDPFGGARIPVKLPARRIPGRAYASNDDLRAAVAGATIEWLHGEAAGG